MIRRLVGTALAAGALVTTAPLAAAADPILPLSEVRTGMVGEARTVVTGTTIERFPVRVLGVQRLGATPGGTLILVRAEGPLITPIGVAEGMSGSPVYITGPDGVQRVIGAIAFGTGDEGGLVVGVTPIESMISSARLGGVPLGARENARPSAAAPALPIRRATLVDGRAAALRWERRHPERRALYPLRRWMIGGASSPVLGPLARALRAQGIRATAAPAAQSPVEAPLVPGASMSALLSAGDLSVGAIGTVTYVDGRTVLGFGHPFLGAGASRFLLAGGDITTTIAAPLNDSSYKLGVPTGLRGMIVGDRTDGIVGRIGGVAGITATSRAIDRDRKTDLTARSTLAPDRRALALLAPIVQGEPAFAVRDGIEGGTLRLTITVRSRALRRPLVYRNVYAAAGDVISLANGELARITTVLGQNGVRSIPISSIDVVQTLERRVRAARIQSARLRPRRARAGQRVRLDLVVADWRGPLRRIRRTVRLPRDLPPGPVTLRVVANGSGGFDGALAPLDGELEDAAAPVSARRALRAVNRRARALTGTRTERLVAAVQSTGPRRNDAVRILLPGEFADDPNVGIAVPVGTVISGGRAVVRASIR